MHISRARLTVISLCLCEVALLRPADPIYAFTVQGAENEVIYSTCDNNVINVLFFYFPMGVVKVRRYREWMN